MNKDHAAFQTTAYLETAHQSAARLQPQQHAQGIAKAIDQVKIEVTMPPTYADNPALFASLLLDTRIAAPQTIRKVIINERKQAVIVGADVEISPVAVMHRNRLIQAGDQTYNEFVGRRSGDETSKTKLTRRSSMPSTP